MRGGPSIGTGGAVSPAFDPRTPVAPGEVMIASYNIENLFDTEKDPATKDAEFFPEGHYHWTEEKLAKKIANVGRAIRAVNGGHGPDILALNEVENRAIVERLRDDALADLGYHTLVHLDTEDRRGIDNAILSRFPLIGEPVLHAVHRPNQAPWGEEKTRGILEATFDVKGVALTVFVNHWPAAPWGYRREQRLDVAKQLRALIEAKEQSDPHAEILVLGDFNANPGEPAFGAQGLGASGDRDAVRSKKPGAAIYGTIAALAESLALEGPDKRYSSFADLEPLLAKHGPQIGTAYDSHQKRWNTIDHLFVSRGLLDEQGLSWVPGSTQIFRAPFLLDAEGRPRETFPPEVPHAQQKPEEIGTSDHLLLVGRLVRH